MIKTYQELISLSEQKPHPKRIVVPNPAHDTIIEGLKRAEDLASPVLVGDGAAIEELLKKHGLKAEVVDEPDPKQALYKALEIVHQGGAEMIMKGKDDTPTFMRAMLDKERGLRTGKLLFHITCFEIPGYHKLVFLSDAGLIIRPKLEEKLYMIREITKLLTGKLGYDEVKVALLASLEIPHEDMPETIEAAFIAKLSDRGRLAPAVVDGPLAFDVAMDKAAAEVKKVKSPVAGDADVLLVPDVASGNMLAKALAMFAGAKMGGFIAGGKVPIVLLSRSDTPERKLYSVAFAVAAS